MTHSEFLELLELLKGSISLRDRDQDALADTEFRRKSLEARVRWITERIAIHSQEVQYVNLRVADAVQRYGPFRIKKPDGSTDVYEACGTNGYRIVVIHPEG